MIRRCAVIVAQVTTIEKAGEYVLVVLFAERGVGYSAYTVKASPVWWENLVNSWPFPLTLSRCLALHHHLNIELLFPNTLIEVQQRETDSYDWPRKGTNSRVYGVQ